MSANLRSVEIIAWNAIIFGIVLYVADLVGKRVRTMENMTLVSAMAMASRSFGTYSRHQS